MSESQVRAQLIRQINQVWGGHAIPIETSHTCVGVPDINYTMSGAHEWIETKSATRTRLHLRGDQVKWMKERIAAGGHPLIWAVAETRPYCYMLFHGSQAKELAASDSLLYWRTRALVLHEGRIDWEVFRPYFLSPAELLRSSARSDQQQRQAARKYGSKFL